MNLKLNSQIDQTTFTYFTLLIFRIIDSCSTEIEYQKDTAQYFSEIFESTLNVYAVKISYFGVKRTAVVQEQIVTSGVSRIGVLRIQVLSCGR